MNEYNKSDEKLAGKVVICDGLYTGKVGTILGTGSSRYSIKLLIEGVERYEPDYALLYVTEDSEQAVKLLLAHLRQSEAQKREEVVREAEADTHLHIIASLQRYAHESGSKTIDIQHLCDVLSSHESLTNVTTREATTPTLPDSDVTKN